VHPTLSIFNQLSAAAGRLAAEDLPPSPSQLAQKRANMYKNHKVQTHKAVDKYREAMLGKGWLTTEQVELALGFQPTGANKFLRKLRGLGIISTRPRGGGKKSIRSLGNEHFWITTKE